MTQRKTGPQWADVEQSAGFRDRTHRYREAKKHDLPIGSGDRAPTMPEFAKMVWPRMVEYSERPESNDDTDLKVAKLKEEINVLKQRDRKLQFENEVTAGNMADVRLLRESLVGLIPHMKKCFDLMGRKAKLTGRDAQQMGNQALINYGRHIERIFGAVPETDKGNRNE